MRKLYFYFAIFIFPFVTIISCNEEKVLIINSGEEYFPLTVGKWLIYEADSIVWDSFADTVDTIRFQIKEEIIGSYTDTENRPAVSIERSYRSNANRPWFTADLWYAVRDDKVAERVENNLRFTKLSFPLIEGKQWQGNGFINDVAEFNFCQQQWSYTYTQMDTTFTTSNSFTNVLEVTQIDVETGLSKCFSKEYYAPNVGLISKSLILVRLSDPNESIPWQEKVNQGYIYNQRLIEHN